MKRPLISVIVPIYNASDFIQVCVESIKAQTYENLEIILVDDGSTDASSGICDELSYGDSRVRAIHKENGGPTSCRKLGFEESKGEYIYYVDADDYIATDTVEKLLNACLKNNAEVSACGFSRVGESIIPCKIKTKSAIIEKSEFVTEIILPAIDTKAEDATDIPLYLWNHLYKSDCITVDCFVSDRVSTREDAYFNLSILDNVGRIAVVSEPLYFYRTNSDSLTVSYRQGKLEKDLYYFGFLRDYLAQRGIEAEDRINRMQIVAMLGCIDNFCKSGSFSTFKKGMSNMKSDTAVREIFKRFGSLRLSSLQQISCKLWNKNLFLPLYIYRKAVIVKNARG